MATYTIHGKYGAYEIDAPDQDTALSIGRARDEQERITASEAKPTPAIKEPTDFLSNVARFIYGPGQGREDPGMPPGEQAKLNTPPWFQSMLPQTPGQLGGMVLGGAVGGGLGRLATKLPATTAAQLLRRASAPLIGEAGLQVQSRTPALFGEPTESPSLPQHAAALGIPYLAERLIGKPAVGSTVQKSRELMKTVGVPAKSLETAAAQSPERITRPIFERLQREGTVPSSTKYEEFLADTAAAVRGDVEQLRSRRLTQQAAAESAQEKISHRREKLKTLNQERKNLARRELTGIEAEQIPAIQDQRDEIARLQNLKLDAETRDAAKEIQKEINLVRAPLPPKKVEAAQVRGEMAAPTPTKNIQNVVDELKTLRSSRRSARQNISRIDQELAKHKVDLGNLKNLQETFRRNVEASGDPKLAETLGRVKDSDDFIEKVFKLPPEHWESLQKFMTPTEQKSLESAFGQYFVRKAYDGDTKLLSRAPEVFEELGWDKIQRVLPGQVGQLRQLADDLRGLSVPTKIADTMRTTAVVGPGRHTFIAFRIANALFAASPDRLINAVIRNPQFGEQFHTLASKGATPAVLAGLPLIQQWLREETTELPVTRK